MKVTDLTLGTNKIGKMVSNWHVSDEPSLSYHRYICFEVGNINMNQVTFRDTRRINCGVVQGQPREKSGDYFMKYTHDKGHRSVY
jgi:hypothetical protein